jgi:hypothetical protein
MSTGVFWVHRRVVNGLPSGITFGRSVAVDVAVTDGGDRAPEGVLVLGVHDGDQLANGPELQVRLLLGQMSRLLEAASIPFQAANVGVA